MLKDVRHAFRILAHNRGFATIAILSLALGIGANTAIFTLIDAIILRSLPVRNPQQLVLLARNPDDPSISFNYPDYRYIRDHSRSFAGVIAINGGGWPLAFDVPGEGGGRAEIAAAAMVSGNYFDVLGVTPAAGRLFTPDDNQAEGASPYAILSYDFWQRRFGRDPRVIGRPVTLNGSPFNIIGVVREGFTGTSVGTVSDLYIPIMMMPSVSRGVRQWNTRHFWWLNVIARLKPGVSAAAAIPEANVLYQQILKSDPERRPAPSYVKDREKRERITVLPAGNGFSYFRRQFSKPLAVLMIVVGMVLLIACANVANLLLARAAARQKEIAIRLAVGASRMRLVMQLVLEAIIVSLAGGLAGLLLAWWGVRVLVGLMPRLVLPVDLNLTPDFQLLGFAFAVSLLTGLACGLVPALQATRPNLVSSLKNELRTVGRSRFDLRRVLVVAQVAISLLLLIGAGLFVRSLRNLRTLDPGFTRESVLLVNINPQASGYKGQRLRGYYERLLSRVGAFPEVRAASLASITPLAGSRWNSDVTVQGYQRRPDEDPTVDFNEVSPGFFDTLGIPIIMGRDFTVQDSPATSPDVPERKLGPPPPVAIINEAMAKKYFPHESPIGRRFSRDDTFKMEGSFEIVGVVKDANYFGLREAVTSMAYIPDWRDGASSRTLCIRSATPPDRLIPAIRREAAALDPSIPVMQTLTLEQQFDNNISQERMVTTLCGFFGALALLLAAIGLYGVMAHSVARRVREIGIRMALGAQSGEVLWLVLRETVVVVAAGALIGLPAAFLLTRLVTSFLFGLTPQDPLTIAGSTTVLLAITALAGYIPARRATKVDPMIALRYE
jgi:putative ABC transport system permease protein